MSDRTIDITLTPEEYDTLIWALGEAGAHEKHGGDADDLSDRLIAAHGAPWDEEPEEAHDLSRCPCDTCDETRAEIAKDRGFGYGKVRA